MSKEFQWTDRLVASFAVKWLNDRVAWAVMHDFAAAPSPIQIEMENFKGLHQPKEEVSGSTVKIETPQGTYWSDKETYEKLQAMPKFAAQKEEKKEPERIDVWGLDDYQKHAGGVSYRFDCSTKITKDKLPLIKQAIESVLNDDRGYFGIVYTPEQVDKMMEDAFTAGKLHHPITGLKYDTFRDYLRHLKIEDYLYSLKNKQP
jgi:hypothetical protein